MQNLDPLDLPPPQEPAAPTSGAELHGVIRVVLDKTWLIVTCVVLAVIAAAVYAKWTPRIYEAVTTVQVEQEDAKIVKTEQVVSEDMRGLEVLNTIAQKLGNTALLQQVLETNNLLPPEGTVVREGSQILTREQVIKNFARDVKTSLRRNTRLIDISVRNRDPRLAAKLANSLVETYLGQDKLTQHNTTQDANAFLKQEADDQAKKLEASEQALQDYRRTNGSISLQQNQDVITPQLQDLNRRLTQSKANLVQAEGAYKDSLNISSNIEELLAHPSIATDPEVEEIATAVARHENDFVLIRQRYREKHPKYILASSSLNALKSQLVTTALKVRTRIQESLHIAYQYAETTHAGLEAELHDAETKALELSDVAVRFNVLSRQVESDKAQFDAIIGRLGETSVAARIMPERIRVIQTALVPELPVSPKVKVIFALAILGGLAAGLGMSFVIYTLDTSFRTTDEVEHYLGQPVLGTVPKLPKSEQQMGHLVAAEDSTSAGAEVFRTLRTTLSMLGRERDRKTYLFTSSLPSEGKTFTSLNYAVSLAQQGLRTLLIDIDLRRPRVEDFFTGKSHHLPGVTDYLLERKKFNEVCQQHEQVTKLFWMPSGGAVPNPSELLMKIDFEKMLAEALTHYDRIVVDTAPLLPVSDTLLLVNKVQTVVLVVHACKTARKAVMRSVQLLNKASAPLGGIVLNLLPSRRLSGYYYSDYHGYGYGRYGYGKKETVKAPVDV